MAGPVAAGTFRRTPLERRDQQVAWERGDQAFFAAGACHVLAYACREVHTARSVGIAAVRFADGGRVFHTVATWEGWAFDHAGWHPTPALLAVNERFEGRAVEVLPVDVDLAEFCARHDHRPPEHFWRDPRPRARAYLARHRPPWT